MRAPRTVPASKKYSIVGKASSRVDGAAKVSGKARYTADRMPDWIVWGKVLRSSLPHARIVHIDVSKARKLPGVLAVLTGTDVPSRLFGRQLRDMPILAKERVRFVGEKVAAVAAESADIAEEAATLIDVEYQELPGVFDSFEAIREGAPILHEDLARYANAPRPVPEFPNVHSHVNWRLGNCEKGFEQSDFVFEQTFTTQRSHQAYLEPHACLVALGPDHRMSIWSSNKVPFQSKQYLCELLGIDPADVLFHLSPVGGDFGGKGSLMDLPLAYTLAKVIGRPVKMVMTYSEELAAGNPRHPSVIKIKTGVKRGGKLWAREIKMVFDSGAYAAFKPNATINLPGARHASGAYAIPNVSLEAFSVYTNSVPSGHMRGPGDPQVYFAVESHTDYIARRLELDPLELRRINVVRLGDFLPDGHEVDTDCGKKLLKRIRVTARPRSGKGGRILTGRGLAFGMRDIGPGEANVEVGINSDGRAYLLTTVTDTGAGAHTTLRQIVAETLGLPVDEVDIAIGNTDSFTTDIALGGSRVTYMAGRAAAMAALNLKQTIKNIAARRWHCAPDAITTGAGALLGPGKNRISFSDLAREAAAAGIPLREPGHFVASHRAGTLFFFAQLAEVEVDPDTGQLAVLKITSVNDVGTIINPLVHQAQIEGGVVQGLGYAMMEHLEDHEGKIATANLGEYKIPCAADVPRVETINVEDSTGPGPFQSKPIGENTVTPTAAAIANAVYDAIGVQIRDLPITSEKIYFALKNGAAHDRS
jgi:CO/xanthine dehydrogenase Mo-binding subunit